MNVKKRRVLFDNAGWFQLPASLRAPRQGGVTRGVLRAGITSREGSGEGSRWPPWTERGLQFTGRVISGTHSRLTLGPHSPELLRTNRSLPPVPRALLATLPSQGPGSMSS